MGVGWGCVGGATPWGLYGVVWDKRLCSLCTFQPFLLGDPVVPTLRGVSGDVVTVYTYQDMEGRFLQSVALPRAGHNPCQRREMTVSTNNGLVNGPVHNLLMQFFTLGSSKIEVFKTWFYDIVIT